jgi:hypothetical protein
MLKQKTKRVDIFFYKEWENELEASLEGWHGIYIDSTTEL